MIETPQRLVTRKVLTTTRAAERALADTVVGRFVLDATSAAFGDPTTRDPALAERVRADRLLGGEQP